MTDPRRTEQVHPDYADLDTLPPDALVAALVGDQLGAVRAVQAAAPQLTAALEAALQDCEAAAAASDPEAYYAANGIFHRLIYQASGNSFLAREAETLLQRLRPFRRLQLQARGRMGQSLAEHRAILQALASGDAGAAAGALRPHVALQGERFNDLVAQYRRIAGR